MSYEEYEKEKAELRRILSFGNDLRQNYGPSGSGNIKKAVEIMIEDLDELKTADMVSWGHSDVDCVRQAMNRMIDRYLQGNVTIFARDLTLHFGRMVQNWNRAMGINDKTLNTYSALGIRLSTNAKTIEDTEMLLQRLLEKGKRQLRYVPPAWEVSKHYLKSLDKLIERKGKER